MLVVVLYHSTIVKSNKSYRKEREKGKILNTNKLGKRWWFKRGLFYGKNLQKVWGEILFEEGRHEAKILQE